MYRDGSDTLLARLDAAMERRNAFRLVVAERAEALRRRTGEPPELTPIPAAEVPAPTAGLSADDLERLIREVSDEIAALVAEDARLARIDAQSESRARVEAPEPRSPSAHAPAPLAPPPRQVPAMYFV